MPSFFYCLRRLRNNADLVGNVLCLEGDRNSQTSFLTPRSLKRREGRSVEKRAPLRRNRLRAGRTFRQSAPSYAMLTWRTGRLAQVISINEYANSKERERG
jgi:hypothetical protein